MALTTNYGLNTDRATDDFVQPADNNRMADAVDRIVYQIVAGLLGNCVLSGWTINTDKTVAAGAGFVGSCYCLTAADQAITGLTNGALNYVFARTDGTSPEDGTVVFYGSISSSKTSGHILLGTITLDAGGTATASSDTPNDNDRGHFALAARTFSGSGSVSSLPGASTVEVTVDHASQGSFYIPGAITVTVDDADISYVLTDDADADEFVVTFTNTTSYAISFDYTWERKGAAA